MKIEFEISDIYADAPIASVSGPEESARVTLLVGRERESAIVDAIQYGGFPELHHTIAWSIHVLHRSQDHKNDYRLMRLCDLWMRRMRLREYRKPDRLEEDDIGVTAINYHSPMATGSL